MKDNKEQDGEFLGIEELSQYLEGADASSVVETGEEEGDASDTGDELEEGEEDPIEPQVSLPENNPEDNLNVKTFLKSLVENNTWEDAAIKYGEKEYNSILELIEEEPPTKDMVDELLEVQKRLHDERINSSYIKIDNPDDVKVKVAKAILSGTEYEGLVEDSNNIDTIRSYDLTDDNNAAQMIAYYYKEHKNFDLEDKDTQEFLKSKIIKFKEEGVLNEKSEEFRGAIINEFDKSVSERIKEEEKKRDLRIQKEKQEKKDFKKFLKGKEYTDPYIKKLGDLRFEKNQGKPAYISMIESKIKDDKDFEVELLHFILDREDFLTKKSSKKKFETQRRMIEISGKSSSGTKTKTNTIASDVPEELIGMFDD